MAYDFCDAIRNKEIIEFYYDGGKRIVEPYCYGESTRGNLVLRGYQIEGYSSSGENEGWKLFKEDDMNNITSIGQKFAKIRPNYNPNDKAMVRIICSI